ncbi:ABC transporter permease [Pseudoroseicyclus aestuarii]|uniref:ABC-type polysaccharide/polyol phosphate export permease n=1 Tax=Pseudoroseicyclus aestuarii TaxID=1795041 RepID=A0A318SVM1_9RHOB|nr:ABC transporter permease [Pseudoroseicyclus aestuarii]PYE84419.1 ABC-type polysaccharide/polyol phosphate export permease [Pseudoroseicyclus aestuarii]
MVPSYARGAAGLAHRIYHTAVRDIRKAHRNAVAGLLMTIAQAVIFLSAFWLMFTLLGQRGFAIRGDFLLYLMTGIFLFLTHTKTLTAVAKAEGPTSPMMAHAPLNTAITISAAALSTLYLQILSLTAILGAYHVIVTPIAIDKPVGALAMLLLAWITGVGAGTILMALKPWYPEAVTLVSQIYSRASMILSGKMFVANMLPGYLLGLFDWNPLFHVIDQERGFVFRNYNPQFTSPWYPLWVGLALIVIGMMGEFYTRRHASISWGAGR